eukprot:379874_1
MSSRRNYRSVNAQTSEFKYDRSETYLLNSNKIFVKIGTRKRTNSETQLLPTNIAPIKEGNESPSISPSTSTMSSSNPEEKAILIDESRTDDAIYDHSEEEFNELLFSSNSNVKLQSQSVLSIKKYFQDRKQNEKDEYRDKYIPFYELHCLLQPITENKPKSQNEFIYLLDKEWMAYQSFTEQT